MGGGLSHVSRVHAHFMKEEVIEPVKMLNLPQTFGKICAQKSMELRLIRRVDQLQLVEAVENLRSGYAKTRCTAAGHKLLDKMDHSLITVSEKWKTFVLSVRK